MENKELTFRCPDCKKIFTCISPWISAEGIALHPSVIENKDESLVFLVPIEQDKDGFNISQCDECSYKIIDEENERILEKRN